MNIHKYARLTPHGREVLVRRILEEGHRVTEAAHASGVSVRTAYKWLARYRAEGPRGLTDRFSRPHRCPHRTSEARRAQVVALCRARRTYRVSFDSSVRPADSGTVSRSSSSSTSPLRSGGVPVGIRKPATYQFDGRSRPGNCSAPSSWPTQGPTRSSFSASTRRERTSRESVGARSVAVMARRVPYTERRPLVGNRSLRVLFSNTGGRYARSWKHVLQQLALFERQAQELLFVARLRVT